MDGVLENQAVNAAVGHGLNQLFGTVETDQLHLAVPSDFMQGPQRAKQNRFTGAKDAVQVGIFLKQVLGLGEGLLGGSSGVLIVGDDLDVRISRAAPRNLFLLVLAEPSKYLKSSTWPLPPGARPCRRAWRPPSMLSVAT